MKGPFMSTRLPAAAADCTAGLWNDVMVRSLLVVSFAMAPAIQPQVTAQAGPPLPSETPTFEVASIKPNNSGDNGVYFTYLGGRFNATNATLRMLIRNSYGVQDSQIVGGPKWTSSDRFNILAKGEVGQWTPDRMTPAFSVTAEPAAAPADGPSIFTAIRDQLGLKLLSQKSAAEVLVIDRAEHPIEN
jgi:hypothetical protein